MAQFGSGQNLEQNNPQVDQYGLQTARKVDFSYAPFVLLPPNVRINGGISTQTISYTLLPTDSIILANAATAGVTLTLPDATTILGKQYIIKKVDSTINIVTIATTNSQTIDGNPTLLISAQYASFTLISDGANWQII